MSTINKRQTKAKKIRQKINYREELQMGRFQDKIISGKASQPNSRNFSYKKWKELFNLLNSDKKDIEIYHAGLYLNRVLTLARRQVYEQGINKLSQEEAILGIVCTLNREYSLICKHYINSINKQPKGTISAENFILNKPVELACGEADLDSLLESTISLARYALQMASTFSEKSSQAEDKMYLLRSLIGLSNIYDIYIELWHRVCFGYLSITIHEKRIIIHPSNAETAIRREAALARRKYDYLGLSLKLPQNNEILEGAIKCLKYDTATKTLYVDNMSVEQRKINYASFIVFSHNSHYFLNYKLKKLYNLTIYDLWNVLSFISFLPSTYNDYLLGVESNCMKYEDILQYKIYFDENDFITLLTTALNFSKQQSEEILNLLTYNNSRDEDIATKFFIRHKGQLYPLTPTFDPNKRFIAEHWLRIGQAPLDKRGGPYEEFFRTELQKSSIGFNIKVHQTSIKFRVKKQSEQIDCAFLFGNKLFLCEVKCSLFPTVSSERYYYDKMITDAVSQIERKQKFVQANIDQFISSYFSEEKISSIRTLVITNQYEHSGTKINNTIIIDDSALIFYFQNNKLQFKDQSGDSIEIGSTNIIPDWQKQIIEQPFYEEKDVAHQNFEAYLLNIPQHALFRQSIKPHRHSLFNTNINLYTYQYSAD